MSDSRKCLAALSTFDRDRAFPVILAIIFDIIIPMISIIRAIISDGMAFLI